MMPKLKNFKFNLKENDINDYSIINCLKIMMNMRNLGVLSLKLSNNKITNYVLYNLISAISSLKILEQIFLYLDINRLSDFIPLQTSILNLNKLFKCFF